MNRTRFRVEEFRLKEGAPADGVGLLHAYVDAIGTEVRFESLGPDARTWREAVGGMGVVLPLHALFDIVCLPHLELEQEVEVATLVPPLFPEVLVTPLLEDAGAVLVANHDGEPLWRVRRIKC